MTEYYLGKEGVRMIRTDMEKKESMMSIVGADNSKLTLTYATSYDNLCALVAAHANIDKKAEELRRAADALLKQKDDLKVIIRQAIAMEQAIGVLGTIPQGRLEAILDGKKKPTDDMFALLNGKYARTIAGDPDAPAEPLLPPVKATKKTEAKPKPEQKQKRKRRTREEMERDAAKAAADPKPAPGKRPLPVKEKVAKPKKRNRIDGAQAPKRRGRPPRVVEANVDSPAGVADAQV